MTTYARRVGVFAGTMMVVGGIIARGSSSTPRSWHSGPALPVTIAAWLLGGAVPCSARITPSSADDDRRRRRRTRHLRDAFGPLPAFLYAWTLLLSLRPAP
jgi:APA family basic amino acid/polyamine antiporter